ncbi:hypothetical protein GCM10009413_00080 [Tatumella punctata]
MNVTVGLNLRSVNNSAYISKDFDTDIIPLVGSYFEDSVFKSGETKKIAQVTCNFQQNSYYVEIDIIQFDTDGQMKEFAEMSKSHDWK